MTLLGKRLPADMIKVTRFFWIVQMGPKYHHKCPDKEEAGGE